MLDYIEYANVMFHKRAECEQDLEILCPSSVLGKEKNSTNLTNHMNFKIWQNKYNYPLGNNYYRNLLRKSATFWLPGHCLKKCHFTCLACWLMLFYHTTGYHKAILKLKTSSCTYIRSLIFSTN